ncbi:MAG: tRNA (adenosine(37)-N6)-dimethylallyltransferase MiaA [Clostridiales Family XIII bacterium]|jgi:tRNA dimethylallyltransferase|nr:tRNA (adenosine(37)-N6)-dimethylallyltransferase MiaA [Clostridiales Family XIII bacterium]
MNTIIKDSILIVGPTAVGKSEFALEVAEKFDGEIVSADSMQIYRGLRIGTAKPTEDERARVPHHLVDFVDPSKAFSVAEYRACAEKSIQEIRSRGKLPIIAGGTGLYVHSLLYEMDFSGAGEDTALREKYESIAAAFGKEHLHALLREKDSEAAESVHPNNTKRVIRALERVENLREDDGFREFGRAWNRSELLNPVILYLLRDREELYRRIEARVDVFLTMGLEAEVRALLDSGLSRANIAMLGIGYKELTGFFEGAYDFEEAVRLIKRNSRRFAKRQMTWFGRYEDAHRINLSEFSSTSDVMGAICALIYENLEV